ncbi:hypothetical protein NKH77_36920 [Streptomyces sp. M19]
MPADRFRQLLEEHTPLMLTVARTLSARLRDTDRLRADHGARTASVRVARCCSGSPSRTARTRPSGAAPARSG